MRRRPTWRPANRSDYSPTECVLLCLKYILQSFLDHFTFQYQHILVSHTVVAGPRDKLEEYHFKCSNDSADESWIRLCDLVSPALTTSHYLPTHSRYMPAFGTFERGAPFELRPWMMPIFAWELFLLHQELSPVLPPPLSF